MQLGQGVGGPLRHRLPSPAARADHKPAAFWFRQDGPPRSRILPSNSSLLIDDCRSGGMSRSPTEMIEPVAQRTAYKGRAVDVRHVAKELGVRYVLEGSVRRAGRRVRITGQLIDAITGAHLWAERFDGNLEDIFDLQDRSPRAWSGQSSPRSAGPRSSGRGASDPRISTPTTSTCAHCPTRTRCAPRTTAPRSNCSGARSRSTRPSRLDWPPLRGATSAADAGVVDGAAG